MEWQHPCRFLWEGLAFSGGRTAHPEAWCFPPGLQPRFLSFRGVDVPSSRPRAPSSLLVFGDFAAGVPLPGAGWFPGGWDGPHGGPAGPRSPACAHQPPPCRPVWGQLKMGQLLQCLLGWSPCPVTGQSGGERSSPSSSLGPFSGGRCDGVSWLAWPLSRWATSPGLILLLPLTHGCFPRRPLTRSTKHTAPRLFPTREVPGVSCRHGMEVGTAALAPLLVARSSWDPAAPAPGV